MTTDGALPPSPGANQRWRCGACGNLTRFDVTRRQRVTEFVHLDLAGAARVEQTTVREDVLEEIRCRWCDRSDQIEVIERTDAPAQPGPAAP